MGTWFGISGPSQMQGGAPGHDSVQLVNITPITMVFLGDIPIVNGVYKHIYNVWGGTTL